MLRASVFVFECFVFKTTKVKCPTGRASFWFKVLTVRRKTPVKCPHYAQLGGGGWWAILDLSGTLCFKSGVRKHQGNFMLTDVSLTFEAHFKYLLRG